MKDLLDQKNNLGDTALHLAIPTKNVALIRLLLYNQAQADVRNDMGVTPLHLAIDLPEISKLLIEHVCIVRFFQHFLGLMSV